MKEKSLYKLTRNLSLSLTLVCLLKLWLPAWHSYSGKTEKEKKKTTRIGSVTRKTITGQNLPWVDVAPKQIHLRFLLERFSNDCRKTKPKQLLRPITAEADSAMNQSQFLAIPCKSLKAREKWRVHGAIGFAFLLIGWKFGASLLSQSLSVAIAIT